MQDLDNDPVTVTVTIDGVTKSQTIQQTQVARLFSIPFDVIADNISGGEHIVEITADDTYYKGRVTKTYPIKVASIVGANRYVLVDTPLLYFTEYSDYENDPLYEQQFRYIHDEHYFDNSLGKIPDSGLWRHRYESCRSPDIIRSIFVIATIPRTIIGSMNFASGVLRVLCSICMCIANRLQTSTYSLIGRIATPPIMI